MPERDKKVVVIAKCLFVLPSCGKNNFNNKFQKILEPGVYYFWNSMVNVTVIKVDLRRQQLDMTGREIMTEDKIMLRMNFICQYKIVNPNIVIEIKSHEEQLYILLQLVLRE